MKPQTNLSYDKISADCVNPVTIDSEEAGLAIQDNMGISVTKDGKKQMNANIFTDYLRVRFTLVYCEPDCFIRSKKRFYVRFSENWLKKICFAILMEVKAENVWTPELEREYIGALKLKSTFTHAMNINRYYINLANGMFNIDSMKFIPKHDLNLYFTTQLPFNYNKKAKSPKWSNFLKEVFEGDSERIAVLQEIFGYSFVHCTFPIYTYVQSASHRNSGSSTILSIMLLYHIITKISRSYRNFSKPKYIDTRVNNK